MHCFDGVTPRTALILVAAQNPLRPIDSSGINIIVKNVLDGVDERGAERQEVTNNNGDCGCSCGVELRGSAKGV